MPIIVLKESLCQHQIMSTDIILITQILAPSAIGGIIIMTSTP